MACVYSECCKTFYYLNPFHDAAKDTSTTTFCFYDAACNNSGNNFYINTPCNVSGVGIPGFPCSHQNWPYPQQEPPCRFWSNASCTTPCGGVPELDPLGAVCLVSALGLVILGRYAILRFRRKHRS